MREMFTKPGVRQALFGMVSNLELLVCVPSQSELALKYVVYKLII